MAGRIMTIKSSEIQKLYVRCIAKNDKGEYTDIDARNQLADLAAMYIRDSEEAGEIADDSITWCGPDEDGETGWGYNDYCSVGFDDIDLWNYHGRHAPLVSLDCAACVQLPEKAWLLMVVKFERFIEPVMDDPFAEDIRFHYYDERDRPVAECAARVYANLKHKEMQS